MYFHIEWILRKYLFSWGIMVMFFFCFTVEIDPLTVKKTQEKTSPFRLGVTANYRPYQICDIQLHGIVITTIRALGLENQ